MKNLNSIEKFAKRGSNAQKAVNEILESRTTTSKVTRVKEKAPLPLSEREIRFLEIVTSVMDNRRKIMALEEANKNLGDRLEAAWASRENLRVRCEEQEGLLDDMRNMIENLLVKSVE